MAENSLNIRLSLSGVQAIASGMAEVQARATAMAKGLGGAVLTLAGIGGIGAAFAAVTRSGFDLNSTLEQARLGIAAVQKQFNPGAFKNFDEALKVSAKAVDLLKEKAKESPATFEELVGAFQAVSGAATAAGVPLQKQVELVTLMSQALAGLGIRTEQIVQESRALITGNINEDAAAARILGITKGDIEQAKSAGRLFEFLTEKLSAFQDAAKAGQFSFQTMSSNLKNAFAQFSAGAILPIFDEVKKGMQAMLSFDWEGLGQKAGDFIAVGIASGRSGSLDQFLGVVIGAGFEIGVERFQTLLVEMFGLQGGLWNATQRWLVRLGFGLREQLDKLMVWMASSGPKSLQESAQRMQESTLIEKDEALRLLGMESGAGTSSRDELKRLLADYRAKKDADNPPATDLPEMTVRPNMYADAPMQGPGMLKRDLESFQQSFSLALAELQEKWGTWATSAAQAFSSVFESSIQSISDGITGLIMMTKTWGQAFREIGLSILTSVVQAIVQMGVRWIATRILMATVGRAIQAAEIATALGVSAAHAAALSAIWATPATLATTASYGAAASMAPAAIMAATAIVKGTSLATTAFAEGGLTPGRPTLAMVGERGPEFVVNAGATARNIDALRAINDGADLSTVAGSQGDARPVQVHIFFDKERWTEANRDNIEAIAINAMRHA